MLLTNTGYDFLPVCVSLCFIVVSNYSAFNLILPSPLNSAACTQTPVCKVGNTGWIGLITNHLTQQRCTPLWCTQTLLMGSLQFCTSRWSLTQCSFMHRYKTIRYVSAPWQLQWVRDNADGGATWRMYYEAAYSGYRRWLNCHPEMVHHTVAEYIARFTIWSHRYSQVRQIRQDRDSFIFLILLKQQQNQPDQRRVGQ
jgi:hypothetical protein